MIIVHKVVCCLCCLITSSVKKLFCTEEKSLLARKYFNKNLIMSAEENERFELSNICWICNKLFDFSDNKVRDHCDISRKYRCAAHWGCNVNFKITTRIPAIFHNLKGYDSHLTFKELHKFNVKKSVIPNEL